MALFNKKNRSGSGSASTVTKALCLLSFSMCARASSPQVRARRAIESGDQMVLFDVGV